MTDVETQASQRTVVAFISGLLVGGLLVWVFSSTPADTKPTETENTNTAENVDGDPVRTQGSAADTTIDTNGHSLSVPDQSAGTVVTLERVAYPSESGWIVVRDQSGILGAARYDIAAGLQPGVVELLRATVSGGTYEAVFYTNEGDLGFSLAEDKVVSGARASFRTN
jgi:hypothetical protein